MATLGIQVALSVENDEEQKFRNSIPFLVPRRSLADAQCPSAAMFSNPVNLGERKTWTQSEFCTWQNSARGNSPKNV